MKYITVLADNDGKFLLLSFHYTEKKTVVNYHLGKLTTFFSVTS